MAQKISPLLPPTAELLRQLGARLRLARLRRGLTARQVAERAGMAPMTLRGVERGAAGATIGAYVAVLQVLGLESALALLAKSDEVGRELQDAQLPSRPRPRRVAGGGRASSAKKHEAPHDAPSKAQSKAPSWAAAAGFVTSEELARARSAPHPSTHTDEDEQE